jgi:hypothetical protein
VNIRKYKYLWSFILVLSLLSVVLSGCGGQVEFVDFSQLISEPDQYKEQTIILDAFYFSGFEISALSESLEPSGSSNGNLVPVGTLIWVAGGLSQALYDKLYTQTETLSGYAERFGKMRIAGKFESGGKYGHLNGYNYQITITSAIPLEGTPVPTLAVGDNQAEVRPAISSEIPATLMDNLTEAQIAAVKIAGDFILSSSTFKFDGIEGSLKFIEVKPTPISSFRSGYYVFEYQTHHPGHGDRTGQFLAEKLATHSASVLINEETGAIVSAACDKTWDILKEKDLPVIVRGVVVSGGDTTQLGGPLDVHRVFTYRILKDEGDFVNVSYTGYPSSPAGDAAKAKISLEFYDGEIRVSDRIVARGAFNSKTNSVVVADTGDFIQTSLRKSTVLGVVVNIKDTPLTDSTNLGKYIYELLRDDGTYVNVRYVNSHFALSLYNEVVQVGDYMKATGMYDKSTNSLVVSGQDDLIKTYDHRTFLGE